MGRTRLWGALGLLFLTASVLPASGATVSWKNPVSGNWTDGTKWDTGVAPTASEDVLIDVSGGSFTVTLNAVAPISSLTLGATTGSSIQTVSIVGGGTLLPSSPSVVNAQGTLQLSGGTLGGAGSLAVNGALNWVNGTITGSGTLIVSNTLIIGGGDTDGNVTLDGRTLTSGGTATWLNNCCYDISLSNNAVLANTGLFDIQGDRGIKRDATEPQFTNAGTVRKTAGTGTTTVGVNFVNSGTVQPSSGQVAFARSSTFAGTVTGTTTLLFSAGTHTLNGVTLAGTSTTQVNGATVTVNTVGAGATVAVGSTLRLSSGILGGTGPLTVNGALNWVNGTITGTGPLVVNNSLTIGGGDTDGNVTLDGRTLTNAGTATWLSNCCYDISLSNNAVLSNTGTFEIQGDRTIKRDASEPQFTNAGTVRKSAGAGTTTINVNFVNSGTVQPNSGKLALTRSSTFGGTIAGSTTLLFSAGTHTLNGVTLAGTATTQVKSATVNTVGAGATVAAGSTLQLSSGILGGAGPLTVNGTLNWANGTITGTGPLTINNTLTIGGGDPDGNVTLDGRTLTNAGTATWLSNCCYDISLSNNAVLANTGTFEIQGDRAIKRDTSEPQFTNSGIVRKITTTGTTQVQVNFNTSGTLSVESGTLSFTRGFTQTAGGTVLNGGSLATSTSTMLTVAGGVLVGSGTIDGNVSSGGQTSPGFSPGTITITGNYAQTPTSSLRVELGGPNPGTGFDLVQLSGATSTAALNGTLVVELLGGFVPSAGQHFTILTAPNGTVVGNFTSMQFPSVPGIAFNVVVDSKTVTLNAAAVPTSTVTSSPTFTATATQTPTKTATVTATRTGTPTATLTNTAPPSTPTNTPAPSPTSTPTPTPTQSPCVGDCDQSNTVTVEELVKGVNIALGNALLASCPAFDCNGDSKVTVDCLVKAVNAALNGCL